MNQQTIKIKIGYRIYEVDKNISISSIKKKDKNKLGLRKQNKNMAQLIKTKQAFTNPVMGGNMGYGSYAGISRVTCPTFYDAGREME